MRHWLASRPACLTVSNLSSTWQLSRSPVFVDRSILQIRAPEGIQFKLAVIAYRAPHITASQYMSDRLQYVADLPTRRRDWLRLMTSSLLDVRLSRHVSVSDRSFAAAGPRLWNSVLADIQSAPSLTTFYQKLKTWQSSFFSCIAIVVLAVTYT